ncbi:MAG: LamG domain-containing protein [Clostridia bacterium]|nr:LamG domain-containing protein [Clostridia bacterium]
MKNQKGITLITLVITIVILIIITGVVTYNGLEAVNTSQKTAFISELEMIQAKVNVIYEERKASTEKIEYYNLIGQDLSNIDQARINEALGQTSKEGFKFFNSGDLKDLDLDNINQEVLINYDTREVVSLNGFEIEGIRYYKLKDIPNYLGYNVEYTNSNNKAPEFTVLKTKLNDNEYRLTIKDIVYNSNVNGGTVSYKLHSDTNWILNGKNTSFIIKKPGLYDIKFTDTAGNSTIVQEWIYVENGLICHLDGENNTGNGHNGTTTIWKDLTGNGFDANLTGLSNTDASGFTDKALLLDGIDDYGTIQNLKLSKYNDITICSTYKVLTLPTDQQNIAILCSNTSSRGRIFFGYGMINKMAINFRDPDTWLWETKDSLNLQNINHISATFKAQNNNKFNQIFVNTQLYVKDNTIMEDIWNNDDITIGRAFGGSYITRHPLSNSEINNIMIYNRALTDEEIKINYEIDKYRFGITE